MFSELEVEFLRTACAAAPASESVEVKPMVDPTEAHVVVQARLVEVDEEGDEESHADWAALPMLYALALFSFFDARPRGYSEADYKADDALHLEEFLPSVRLTKRGLEWYGDYVKGRRMKTRLCIAPDGALTVETTERGEAARHWLRKLRGEGALKEIVPLGGASH